jgi:uncharacterized protein (DUF934 family)
MRHILRQHEWVPDDWRYADEERAGAAGLIVPWAQLRADPKHWHRSCARLGVRIGHADAVEELAGELPQLQLVAVEFSSTGDGRGYSQGRLLRERLGFSGELRAIGAGVRQDLVFFLARCGFDALELAAGEDPQAARRALTRFDVAYQRGSAQVPLRQQRFH